MPRRHAIILAAVAVSLFTTHTAPQSALAQSARATLDAAHYTPAGELVFPADTDRWVFVGSVMGSEYTDKPFDPAHPSTMGVIQMEPSAYDYFRRTGAYADGTMFLLSFYESAAKSDPQLSGFVEGSLRGQEIHIIDKARFDEKQAFFGFPLNGKAIKAPMPPGSECVICHSKHGAFESTFMQFYPVLRDKPVVR